MTNKTLERPGLQLDMFSTAEDNEAKLYHNEYSTGYFTLSQRQNSRSRMRQQSFPNRDFSAVLTWLFDRYKSGDAYLSQASFRDTSRRIAQVSTISSCWVDLDIYCKNAPQAAKELMFMHDPVDRAHAVIKHCEKENILKPSTIIHSGGGLYAKWLLSDTAPHGLLPAWNAVQKSLLAKFAPFAADPKAIDASRILRVCGSSNSKVPGPAGLVRVVWVQPGIDGAPKTYRFDELTKSLFKYTREEVAALKQLHKVWDSNKKHAVNAVSSLMQKAGPRGELAVKQLWWNRLDDIRTLVALRYDGQGIPADSGKRNSYCWILANALAYNCNPAQLKAEIVTEFSKICDNYSAVEIRGSAGSVLSRMKHGTDLYKMSNPKFIELLDIKPSEASKLKTLGKGKAKKKAVNEGIMGFEKMENLKYADYVAETTRRRQAAGKYTASVKRANSADDRALALRLHSEGVSLRGISRELGRSTATIHDWLNEPK